MRTRWQLLYIVTGALVAVLLIAHMVVLHLDGILGFFGSVGLDPISWSSMVENSRHVTWVGIYVALLAVAIIHALYGLRGIIFELNPSPSAERWISRSFVVVGILVFAWGAAIPLTLF